MDASIDASLPAPKVSGTWKAAGPFILKGGVLTAMAAAARSGGWGRSAIAKATAIGTAIEVTPAA